LKANSTAGRCGKCDSVFGCVGTICMRVDDPLDPTRFFLSLDKSHIVIASSAAMLNLFYFNYFFCTIKNYFIKDLLSLFSR
jgi:hypothetical protein